MKPICVVLPLAITLNAACSTFSIRSDKCPALPPEQLGDTVKVQYLGSGGYMVQRGSDVVLFGPTYSNPGLAEVLADSQIRTDRALVDSLLPKDAEDAAAIVVGHSHYDHAMDTPYIAEFKARKATVYGSATMKNLMQSAPLLIENVGPYAEAGTYIEINPRLRLWPIRSHHSDQTRTRPRILGIDFFGIDLPVHKWRGEVTEAQSKLPATASEWAEGEVYSYVLDFMTGSTVDFRIYYQDSGTDEPIGYPWVGGVKKEDRGIDVALICVGGDFKRIKKHPEGIIKAAKPRFLVMGHWETVFEPQTDICRTNKVDAFPHFKMYDFTDEATDEFKDVLKKSGVKGKPILPCPTASVFHFPTDKTKDQDAYDRLKKTRLKYDCSKILP